MHDLSASCRWQLLLTGSLSQSSHISDVRGYSHLQVEEITDFFFINVMNMAMLWLHLYTSHGSLADNNATLTGE